MSANHSATAAFAKVPKCVVPKVVGLKLAKAKARIKKAHCRVGKVTKRFSTRKKKGRVLSQRPKPRKTLKSGAKVNLVVGKGPKRR
jgi:beta-lactam-binding protein with PASTA domain